MPVREVCGGCIEAFRVRFMKNPGPMTEEEEDAYWAAFDAEFPEVTA
ncbi:MAG: hypothetical protein KGI89_15755 [Euryarchaeota archaeon]|nr:hypothetical protein [Euryarchaeota archaeon]